MARKQLEARAPDLPADLSEVGWAKLVEYGQQAGLLGSVSCWALGDLAVEVSNSARYGDHALDRFADEVDVSPGTLRNYKVVSESYDRESALRRAVSFSVAREFKDEDDRVERLLNPPDGVWTLGKARQFLMERKSELAAARHKELELERQRKLVQSRQPVQAPEPPEPVTTFEQIIEPAEPPELVEEPEPVVEPTKTFTPVEVAEARSDDGLAPATDDQVRAHLRGFQSQGELLAFLRKDDPFNAWYVTRHRGLESDNESLQQQLDDANLRIRDLERGSGAEHEQVVYD
jgi:hypothetical protein